MNKFSTFTQKTFSELNNPLFSSSVFLVGVKESDSSNIKVNFLELLNNANQLGSGKHVYKDTTSGKQFNFRSLVSTNKLTITETATEINFDVNEGNLSLNNISGVLGLNKGGTGSNLTDPQKNALFFWNDTTNKTEFLGIGTGLSINNGSLESSFSSPLTTKGDLFVYGTDDIRLPVGTSGQYLTPDSAQTSGLKWASLPTANNDKVKVDSAATAGYIGNTASTGVIRTTSKLTKTDGGDFVTLNVNEPNINLSNADNTSSNFEQYYDSGWKTFLNYSTSGFGIYPYTNITLPEFRVINRTIYFRGQYLIGLDDTGIVSDFDNVRTNSSNSINTASTGLSISNNVITTPKIFNGITFDTFDNSDFEFNVIRSSYAANSSNVLQSTLGLRYMGASRIRLSSLGEFKFSDLEGAFEEPSYTPSSRFYSSNIRRAVDIATSGQMLYTFQNYQNAFDSSGTTDQAEPVASSGNFHYISFDGTNSSTWGGSTINLNGFYALISSTETIASIKSTIEAL